MLKPQKQTGIYLLSVEHVEGFEVTEYIGLVTGASIVGANFMKDFMANLTDKLGGRARGYERAMNGAMDSALTELAHDAKKLGADAVIGVRIQTNDMAKSMLMATASGTAVKLRRTLRNG